MGWWRRLFGGEELDNPRLRPVGQQCEWCGRADLHGYDLSWRDGWYGHNCLPRLRFEEIKRRALENVRKGMNQAAAFYEAEQSLARESALYELALEKEREYLARAEAEWQDRAKGAEGAA